MIQLETVVLTWTKTEKEKNPVNVECQTEEKQIHTSI